ncbi:MAG: hypothetical protein ACYCU7_07030 [Acidimicrobiales bacterium]
MFFLMSQGHDAIGPGLIELLGAQDLAEEIVSWPLLERYATALSALQQVLPGRPVVWPTDPAAERLAGAAALVGGQSFRLRGWGQLLDGEHVLLTVVVALSPLPLSQAARHARALGAVSVVGCGADVRHRDGVPEGLDDFVVLTPEPAVRRRIA